MQDNIAKVLKKIRQERNLSQQQLANMLFVDRTSIANWETARRMPDAVMLMKIAKVLQIDPALLLVPESDDAQKPVVILVDDVKIILDGTLPVLKDCLPKAEITGFLKPSSALEYAKRHAVDIAFLDIEMGTYSGFDLCKALLAVNPNTNVVFLTAYIDHSFEAWDTGACGFLLKPLDKDTLKKQLSMLKHPVKGLE